MKTARRLGASVLTVALIATPALLPANASGASDTPRIVGGSVVSPPSKYPFFVALRGCGASLLRSTWVLTAAHCIDNTAPEQVTVRVGVFDLDNASDGEARTIKRIIVHPDWAQRNNNDVALVELDTPSSRPTIDLARAPDRGAWAAGSLATVIGHGRTAEGGAASDVLKELAVPIIDDATMALPDVYGTAFRAETMVGAGTLAGGEDSCQGDSGGPLITRTSPPKQVGVVSFGEGCARPNKPGVYARVGEGPLQTFIDNTVLSPPGNLPPRIYSRVCGGIVAVPVFGDGLTGELGAYDPEDEDDVDSSVEDVELSFPSLPSYAQATQRDEGDNVAIATIVIRPSLLDALIDFLFGLRTVTIRATDNDGASSSCSYRVRPTLFGEPEIE